MARSTPSSDADWNPNTLCKGIKMSDAGNTKNHNRKNYKKALKGKWNKNGTWEAQI